MTWLLGAPGLQAQVELRHEPGGTRIDTIWILPPADGSSVTFDVHVAGVTDSCLDWACDQTCDDLPPSARIESLDKQSGTEWNVTTWVSLADVPTAQQQGGWLQVFSAGLPGQCTGGATQACCSDAECDQGSTCQIPVTTVPDARVAVVVPTLTELQPVAACPSLDRPGFIKGRTVGTEVPEDRSFPQITYVTVKPCGICDFTLNGSSPVTAEVKFRYRNDPLRDGDRCTDPSTDNGCDAAQYPNNDPTCDATQNAQAWSVWRKDFDVQPFVADSSNPLTVFIDVSNNLAQSATTQKEMELVAQLTKAERDAQESGTALPPGLPLWAADPPGYLFEAFPALSKLAELLGTWYSMQIDEELNATVIIRVAIQLPPWPEADAGGLGDGTPAAPERSDKESNDFSFSGGFEYSMSVQGTPSDFDLAANLEADGEFEITVPLTPPWQLVGGGKVAADASVSASASLDPESLVDVMSNFELNHLLLQGTIGGGASAPIEKIKRLMKYKVVERFLSDIELGAWVTASATVQIEGDDLDTDSYRIVNLGLDPGPRVAAELAFDTPLAELAVGAEGGFSVPINYYPNGLPGCSADWCLTIDFALSGALNFQARTGPFVLVSFSPSAEGSWRLATVKPEATPDTTSPSDPPAEETPMLPRESFIHATAQVVDSRNNLWFAFVANSSSGQVRQGPVGDGTLVVWNCGTDHQCGNPAEHVLDDPGSFAHSPAIAVGPDDQPVVAWVRAPVLTATPLDVDIIDSSIATRKFDPMDSDFDPARTVVFANPSKALRYGLAMEAADSNRVSLVYVEDLDQKRFACRNDTHDPCSEPLPSSVVRLAEFDFSRDAASDLVPDNLTDTTVSETTSGVVRDDPDLALAPDGRVLVVWEESAPSHDLPTPPELYARVVDGATPESTPRRLTDNGYTDTQASVDFDSLGNALIAWSTTAESRTSGTPALNTLFPESGPAAVVAVNADGGGARDLWVYPTLDADPERPHDAAEDQRDPAVRGCIVVYSSLEDGGDHYDLWLLDLCGALPQPYQLTDDPFHQHSPTLWVDSTASSIKVVYVSQQASPTGPGENLGLLQFSRFELADFGDPAIVPETHRRQLTDTEFRERDPAFDDTGNRVIFSASTATRNFGTGYAEVRTDGCNLWHLGGVDVATTDPLTREPFTGDPGCETEPTWDGDRVVYRCEYQDEMIEQRRPEAPCTVVLRADAAGGQGNYQFDWLIDGAAPLDDMGLPIREAELLWPFANCSLDGQPATHAIEVTVQDASQSYTTGIEVGTDGIRAPLRVDVNLSRGMLLAPQGGTAAPQQVTFDGRIAGGEPPYRVKFLFGDGAESPFESVPDRIIAPVTHAYLPPTELAWGPACDAVNGPFCGKAVVEDASGMTASREFHIDVGPLRHVEPGAVSLTAGRPLKAVARAMGPAPKRWRHGLCAADATLWPAKGGAMTRLLVPGTQETAMSDARDPALANDRLVFFMRPAGMPPGTLESLVSGTLDAAGSLSQVDDLNRPRLPLPLTPEQALQNGRFSRVRVAVLRLGAGGAADGHLSPAVDLGRPAALARHPQIAAGRAGNFVVVWRGDHAGGQETTYAPGLDGDIFFATGEIGKLVPAGLYGPPGLASHSGAPVLTNGTRGILEPDRWTSWRSRVDVGPSGVPTVAWIDRDDADQNDDLPHFFSSLSMPQGSWPSRPPFGPDGSSPFDVGRADGTFCPLQDGFVGPSQGPVSLNVDITSCSPPAPCEPPLPAFPVIDLGGETLVITPQPQPPWVIEVWPTGEVRFAGPVSITRNGMPQQTTTFLSFTTGPLQVQTHPGADRIYCTPDDRAGETFLLLGQPVDANGTAVLNSVIGLDDGSEVLAQVTLRFSSEALAKPRLLLSETGSSQVLSFDVTAETLIAFGEAGPDNLSAPGGLAIGPDGHVYVADAVENDVKRFDGTTGAFDDVFVGGLDAPRGLAFDAGGNLYVVNRGARQVLRYDPLDGPAVVFGDADAAGSGLENPYDLAFGPDGRLYVSDSGVSPLPLADGGVKVYSATGNYEGDFVPIGAGGLDEPHGLTFGPDNNLYVASRGTNDILRYEGASGAPLGTFGDASFAGSGLLDPTNLAFGPDNRLYVTSDSPSLLAIYENGSGAFVGVLGGLISPTFLTFHRIRDADLDGVPDNIDTCGDGVVDLLEACDGRDDRLCPGSCQLDCRCPDPGPFEADSTARLIQHPTRSDIAPYWDAGIIGSGQIVSFHDTGFSLDAADMSHTAWASGFIEPDTVQVDHRKVVGYESDVIAGGVGDFLSCDGPGDLADHGVVVSGTAIGSATRFVDPLTYGAPLFEEGFGGSPGVFDEAVDEGFDGVAPGAKAYLWDAESVCFDPPVFPDLPVTGLTEAWNAGARVHNLSFGNVGVNVYSAGASTVDQHQTAFAQSLVVVAAGDTDQAGTTGTLSSLANCKNCVVVGAAERFSTSTDFWAVLVKSALGPTPAGRPGVTLVAPAADYSCKSSDADQAPPIECVRTAGGKDSAYFGTSIATAAVSGAALLVRDYLARGFYPDGSDLNVSNPLEEAAVVSGALVRAMLIASTDPVNVGPWRHRFNGGWGYGVVNLSNVLPVGSGFDESCPALVLHDGVSLNLLDMTLPDALAPNQSATHDFRVEGGGRLAVVLTWNDPGPTEALTRDLDLTLTYCGADGDCDQPDDNIEWYGNWFTEDRDLDGQFDAGEDLDSDGVLDASFMSLPTDWDFDSVAEILPGDHDSLSSSEAVFVGVRTDGQQNTPQIGQYRLRVTRSCVQPTDPCCDDPTDPSCPQKFAVALAGPVAAQTSAVCWQLPSVACGDAVAASLIETDQPEDLGCGPQDLSCLASRLDVRVFDETGAQVDGEGASVPSPGLTLSRRHPGSLIFDTSSLPVVAHDVPVPGDGRLVHGDGFRYEIRYADLEPSAEDRVANIFGTPCAVDADGDGAVGSEDCDDSNPSLNRRDDDRDGRDSCVGDCDDNDPNNWVSCGFCVDMDGDGGFLGCDAYVTISGPDCDDGNSSVRIKPGAVRDLRFINRDTLVWSPQAGALTYDVVSYVDPLNPGAAECLESDDTDTTATDARQPQPLLFYLVRPENSCGGTVCPDSRGIPRLPPACHF